MWVAIGLPTVWVQVLFFGGFLRIDVFSRMGVWFVCENRFWSHSRKSCVSFGKSAFVFVMAIVELCLDDTSNCVALFGGFCEFRSSNCGFSH